MLKASHLETERNKSVSTTQIQDTEGYKLTDQGSALTCREAFSWAQLSATAASATDVFDLLCGDGGKVHLAVAALAAWHANNETILGQISMLPDAEVLLCASSQEFDIVKVSEAALGSCIVSLAENSAIDILPHCVGEISLANVHRAGEQGMLRLLTAVVKHRVPVQTNTILASLSWRIRRILKNHQSQKRLRFNCIQSLLRPEDVLKWACLIHRDKGYSAFLKLKIEISEEAVVETLIMEGMLGLLSQLINNRKLKLTDKAMIVLLQNGQIALAAGVLRHRISSFRFNTPCALRSYQVVQSLVSAISRPKDCLDAVSLLLCIEREDWTSVEFDMAETELSSLISPEHVDETCLCNHNNPLLIAIATSELANQLSKFSLLYREKFAVLDKKLRVIAEKIQSQYSDYHALKVMYVDKSFGGKSLFEVLVKNTARYRELLKGDLVVAIVEDLWSGGDSVGLGFYHLTSITEYFNDFDGEFFTVHKRFTLPVATKSVFQLHFWRHNGTLRLVVESLALLFVFCVMVASLIFYLKAVTILESPQSSLEDLQMALDTFTTLVSLNNVYMSACALLVLFDVQKCVYKLLLKESPAPGLRELLDFSLFSVSFIIKMLNDRKDFQEFVGTENVNPLDEILFAIMFFLCSFRISSVLLQTRMLGPVLRMMFVIVKDILGFLIIYALLVVSCAVFFVPLFRRDEEYFGSIEVGARTLFQWSVGGIDASVFTYRTALGSVLTVTWALISTVIVLNLLIAMLSRRYEDLAPQVTADYVSILYHSYCQTRYEPPYGALVMAPPPFNFVHWLLIFPYVFFPDSAKTLDRLFVILSYQVMFATGLIVFLVYSALLATCAFFIALFRFIQVNRGRGLHKLIIWICVGPLYLSALVVISLKSFCRSMYNELEEETLETVPDEIFISALRFLEKIHEGSATETCLLSDLIPAISRLPGIANAPRSQLPEADAVRAGPVSLTKVANRVYNSKASMTSAKLKRILDFFEQFASVSEGSPRIHLTRMLRILRESQHDRRKLRAFNIAFVMKAVASVTGKSTAGK